MEMNLVEIWGGMSALVRAVVLVLTALYGQYSHHPLVSGALRGMGAVAAGLVISTALKLLATLRRNPMGRWLALAFAALTFVTTALLRWPLVWVVIGLGSLAMAVAWHRLARTEPPR